MVQSLAMPPALGATWLESAVGLLGNVSVVRESGNLIFKETELLDCLIPMPLVGVGGGECGDFK